MEYNDALRVADWRLSGAYAIIIDDDVPDGTQNVMLTKNDQLLTIQMAWDDEGLNLVVRAFVDDNQVPVRFAEMDGTLLILGPSD
jgi:hypothetical protein